MVSAAGPFQNHRRVANRAGGIINRRSPMRPSVRPHRPDLPLPASARTPRAPCRRDGAGGVGMRRQRCAGRPPPAGGGAVPVEALRPSVGGLPGPPRPGHNTTGVVGMPPGAASATASSMKQNAPRKVPLQVWAAVGLLAWAALLHGTPPVLRGGRRVGVWRGAVRLPAALVRGRPHADAAGCAQRT
eukprot:scaffold7215_cov366-Prasinococcus_capsulatus_cf.AAC.28